MKPASVVITGGAGFVGRHLIHELQSARIFDRIVVWDRTVPSWPAGVEGQEIDITDPTSYEGHLAKVNPSWIIHLAAISAVPTALKDPAAVFAVNATATADLLTVMQRVAPHARALVISTADIYGAMPAAAAGHSLTEQPLSAAQPANPYAESKLAMEKMIEEQFNDRVIRVRPFPHIGPGQRPGFVTADFASQIAAIEAGRQEPVLKVGNLTARRDFTDVRDVVRAYRLLLEHGQVGEVYHVASGQAVAIEAILQQLLALAAVDITVEQDPARLRPSDVPALVGDASKLRAATGWQPTIPLPQSLQDILAFWRKTVAST